MNIVNKQPKLVKVTTIRAIRIDGEHVDAGSTLSVPEQLASELIGNNKAAEVDSDAAKAAVAAAAEAKAKAGKAAKAAGGDKGDGKGTGAAE